MKCIIVDDEPLAREGMELNVQEVPFLDCVGTFPSALDANEYLHENEVDLVFLDIQMPDRPSGRHRSILWPPPAGSGAPHPADPGRAAGLAGDRRRCGEHRCDALLREVTRGARHELADQHHGAGRLLPGEHQTENSVA